MFKKLLYVLTISILLAGCGDSGKTIDFSSKTTMQQSIKAMSEKLDDQEKAKFKQSLIRVGFAAGMLANDDEEQMFKLIQDKLAGKTAAEIIKEYGVE